MEILTTKTILPLGSGIELHLDDEQAERAWAILTERFGTVTSAVPAVVSPGLVLDANHSMWASESGKEGHRTTPWGTSDLDRAEVFYGALRGKAKMFFDLLLDNPGRVIDTAEFNVAYPGQFLNAYAVAGAINGLRKPHKVSERRYPFSYWQTEGAATRYAVHPDVARLFEAARKALS